MSFVRAALAGLLVAGASVSFYQLGLGADNVGKSELRDIVAPDL
jgi:hypothetical protein